MGVSVAGRQPKARSLLFSWTTQCSWKPKNPPMEFLSCGAMPWKTQCQEIYR